MRTTAVLVALLLIVGLNLGASVALAGDHASFQLLSRASQPVSDVELSQIRGKFHGPSTRVVFGRGAWIPTVSTSDYVVYRNTLRVFTGLAGGPGLVTWDPRGEFASGGVIETRMPKPYLIGVYIIRNILLGPGQ
jgi:hypothetical protein